MPVAKNPKSQRPLDVQPSEPAPPAPEQRESRLLAHPNAAAIRSEVEQILHSQDTLDEEAVLRLDEDARAIVRRMVSDPSARDVPFRREAVTALGIFQDPGSVMLLAELLNGREDDPVLVGRAADAMARIGGAEAAMQIAKALDHPDRYASDRAAAALCVLGHRVSTGALADIAASNRSQYLRDAARRALERLNIEPPKSHFRRDRKVARSRRTAQEE